MESVFLVGMIASGLFFGWTIGSHYTGAVMGTAFGAKLITARKASFLIAISTSLGLPWKATTWSRRSGQESFPPRT